VTVANGRMPRGSVRPGPAQRGPQPYQRREDGHTTLLRQAPEGYRPPHSARVACVHLLDLGERSVRRLRLARQEIRFAKEPEPQAPVGAIVDFSTRDRFLEKRNIFGHPARRTPRRTAPLAGSHAGTRDTSCRLSRLRAGSPHSGVRPSVARGTQYGKDDPSAAGVRRSDPEQGQEARRSKRLAGGRGVSPAPRPHSLRPRLRPFSTLALTRASACPGPPPHHCAHFLRAQL
jgi:hypothetical protein